MTTARIMFLTLVCVVPSFLSAQDNPKPYDWRIIPRENIGPISSVSTASELKKIFGEENVESDRIYLGEGFTEPGTIIFPHDKEKTISILWKDSVHQQYPKEVRIIGSQSVWRIYHDITLGTTLKELEALNGKPFVLVGFAWDCEGAVMSWEKGKLTEPLSSISLNLTPDMDARSTHEQEYDSVMGDHNFPSSNGAMQILNPKVCLIRISFK